MATETTELRWFEETDRKCSCGARATGILRGVRNESYGPHCKRCANRRLKASEKARAAIAKAEGRSNA
jgi:hypothetical protein